MVCARSISNKLIELSLFKFSLFENIYNNLLTLIELNIDLREDNLYLINNCIMLFTN